MWRPARPKSTILCSYPSLRFGGIVYLFHHFSLIEIQYVQRADFASGQGLCTFLKRRPSLSMSRHFARIGARKRVQRPGSLKRLLADRFKRLRPVTEFYRRHPTTSESRFSSKRICAGRVKRRRKCWKMPFWLWSPD